MGVPVEWYSLMTVNVSNAAVGVLCALAARLRAHGGAVSPVRHRNQTSAFWWAILALLPAVPAPALTRGGISPW